VDLEDFFVDIGLTDCLDSLVTTDRVGSAVCADHASCDECNGFFEDVECHDLRRSTRLRACDEVVKESMVLRQVPGHFLPKTSPGPENHCILPRSRKARKPQVGFSRRYPIRLWLWGSRPHIGGIGMVGSAKLEAGFFRYD
jgi:hypothetical protein